MRLNISNETLDDDMHHIQAFYDARIGNKTADTSFIGYKTHIAMSEERITTAETIINRQKNYDK